MNSREMCREWLRDEALFLDTETTGLDGSAEIVEIAVADHEGKPLFDSLILSENRATLQERSIRVKSNRFI